MQEKCSNCIPNLQSVMFSDIEWYVLCRRTEKLLIMSKNILGIKPYDNVFETELWETCKLRKYLNTEFLKQFSPKDRKRIIKTFNINEKIRCIRHSVETVHMIIFLFSDWTK